MVCVTSDLFFMECDSGTILIRSITLPTVRECAEGQIPSTVGYVDEEEGSGYLLVQGEKNLFPNIVGL